MGTIGLASECDAEYIKAVPSSGIPTLKGQELIALAKRYGATFDLAGDDQHEVGHYWTHHGGCGHGFQDRADAAAEFLRYVQEEIAAALASPSESTLSLGEPDPEHDIKDAALEFRFGIPTLAQIAVCRWWLTTKDVAICFKNADQRPVVWRQSPDNWWHYGDCPQPLKPRGSTWREIDAAVVATAPEPHRLGLGDTCQPPVRP